MAKLYQKQQRISGLCAQERWGRLLTVLHSITKEHHFIA
nr:hypothetical protein Iba_chr09dCG9930 [Ipomoea batatas]